MAGSIAIRRLIGSDALLTVDHNGFRRGIALNCRLIQRF
ncbi:hypothetical protein HDG34_006977 [Paraburkholderia sp. HC6.4b]|nr:hypothetical protein [Paraburkholderia sp. HC6.4b]MBB5455262.1 hypothetical protein [Paraburkholderia sp. Kb1A]